MKDGDFYSFIFNAWMRMFVIFFVLFNPHRFKGFVKKLTDFRF